MGSLEEKRANMRVIFQSAGLRVAELPDVNNSLALTYIYERYMINTCPPPRILEIEKQWPFLFTKRGLCTHFQTLTDIDISDCLGEALKNKGKWIIKYFQKQEENRNIQSLFREMESATGTLAMQSSQTRMGAVLL